MRFILFLRRVLGLAKRPPDTPSTYDRQIHALRYHFSHLNNAVLAERMYVNVRQESDQIENFHFLIAETPMLRESGTPRQHKRFLSNDRLSVTYGHPLIYCDTYLDKGGYKTYLYARHKLEQSQFLLELDFFLEEKRLDFHELADRELKCTLNIDGNFVEKQITSSFTFELAADAEKIWFMRVYVPFGDISAEFAQEASISSDELTHLKSRALPRRLETPLFGFDCSKSTLWAPFLAKIHWASGLIPSSVLQQLIEESAAMPVAP